MSDWLSLNLIVPAATSVVVAYVLYWYFVRPAKQSIELRIDDLSPHFGRLAADEVSFLIVTVSKSGEFLQFSGPSGHVQLSLPLNSQEQKELEPKLLAALTSRGLSPYVTIGSDGARFLDAELNGTPDQVAALVAGVFQEVFGLQAGDIVIVEW